MAHVHFGDGLLFDATARSEFELLRGTPGEEFAGPLSQMASASFGGPAPHSTTHLVNGRPTEDELALESMQAVIVPFAGIPPATSELLRKFPNVKLYNLHHNAAATAEYTVGLLLAAARGIVSGDRLLRNGRWHGRHDSYTGFNLAGRTATIYGFGSVGRIVGKVLSALGMDVIGISRAGAKGEANHWPQDRLMEALERSHALVVTAPLTAETRGSIGAQQIEALRSPRLLVNVGRGPIVDESALYEACRDGVVAAAGIDVWYQYPGESDDPVFPSTLPFQELENVVLSPHQGGGGDDAERLRLGELGKVLFNLIQGMDVKPVDLDAGY